MPSANPIQSQDSKLADKAIQLIALLGLSEAEVDGLIRLLATPALPAPQGAPPRAEAIADAYTEPAVEALVRDHNLRMPLGIKRTHLRELVYETRLLLRVRDGLLRLAQRCEGRSARSAEVLDRVALALAPQLRMRDGGERDMSLKPLLSYYDRRCRERGGVVRMSAAREATLGRIYGQSTDGRSRIATLPMTGLRRLPRV